MKKVRSTDSTGRTPLVRKHFGTLVMLLAILPIALALRLAGLSTRGLWWDEIALWSQAMGGEVAPHHAPFVATLMGLWIKVTGHDNEFLFHLPSAVFGALAVIPTYFYCKGLTPPPKREWAALTGCSLVALSPLMLFYSQEARPYGFLFFGIALMSWAFVAAVNRPSRRRLVVLALSIALACWTHLTAVFQVIGMAGFWLLVVVNQRLRHGGWNPSSIRQALGHGWAIAGGTVLGTIWLFFRPGSVGTVLEGYYPFGLSRYLATTLAALGPYPTVDRIDWPTFAVSAGYFSLFCLGVRYAAKRHELPLALAVAISAVVSFTVLYLTLGVKGNWSWLRYLSHLAVPYLACVAVGWWMVIRRIRETELQAIATAILLVVLYPGLVQWWSSAGDDRSRSYRESFSYLAQHVDHLDGLIIPARISRYADETSRLYAYLHLYGQSWTKPVYLLENGRFYQVLRPREHPELSLPQRGQAIRLAPGSYAVFRRRNASCRGLAEGAFVLQPLAQTEGLPVPNSHVALCELVVSGD